MKLRDRTKRVLGNVKQEEHKPALNTLDSTTFTDTDANTFDLTIKQEETKEHKDLSKQDGNLDQKEYYHQCDLCKMKMANLKSVLEHRTLTHGIKQRPKRVIKNIDVDPDVHNPSFYCKSCERDYNSANTYRFHLKRIHYMILKPVSRCKLPKNAIDPDPNEPNFYCRACDYTYKRKYIYKRHCRFVHGLNPATSKRTRTSGTMTDSYCQACDKRLSSIDSCRRHLLVIHKVDSRPAIQQRRSDIMPNVNDPNFYCRSCEKKLANKNSFRQHLMSIHSIFQSATKRSSLKPDIDDPDKHCRVCQKSYISKGIYRAHLRLVHQMTLRPLIGNVNREQLPDPYDPDYHCSVCKKTYASLKLYRLHCKRVHFMTLNHASILNPGAEINVNDPKLYCAQCERSFCDKRPFKRHLAQVHGIY